MTQDQPDLIQRLDQVRDLSAAGDADGAARCIESVIDLGPAAFPALRRLGLLALEAEQLDLADLCLTRLHRAAPDDPAVLCAVGRVHVERRRFWDAMTCFQTVLNADPAHATAADGLAHTCMAQERPAEAEQWWRRCLALGYEDYGVQFGLAGALRSQLRFDQAARHLERAARLAPPGSSQNVTAHLMRALTLLAIGDWVEGWTEYEHRMMTSGLTHAQAIAAHGPRWSGQSDPAGVLLVIWEQGLGDTLHFVRYLRILVDGGMRVILFCQDPLRRLIESNFGPSVQVVSGMVVPAFTWQIPLLSLPLALLPRLGTAIPVGPYLSADPDRVAAFRRRVEAVAPGRPRLALAWQGNPRNSNDWRRSIDAGLIAAMLELDAEFFVIQPGASIETFSGAGYANIHDLTDGIDDFFDTAAALVALDGLISVDTSVVHLAGALGRPVWLPLPFIPDWRWGVWGNRTPWYPTVRLFRQPAAGDWPPALLALCADLVQWLRERG